MAEHGHDNKGSSDGSGVSSSGFRHRTACFTCRTSKQRCDRRMPCSRCVLQGHTCSYPLRSNRGRKEGSTNKPDTVEKLLSRINNSPARDQVIAAIINATDNQRAIHPSPLTVATSTPLKLDHAVTTNTETNSNQQGNGFTNFDIPDTTTVPCPCYGLKKESARISPLHVMADVAATDRSLSHRTATTPTLPTTSAPHLNESQKLTNERLIEYFMPQIVYQKDWDIVAAQSISSTLKLEPTTFDPLNSRLIDKTDVALYFKLFFGTRNPLVGLLDPDLHTFEHVYHSSFTLFSVICALGCAISTRSRDRIVYTTLLALAEANIMWSIAVSVKSLETIQSIICMKYWGPTYRRQGDDPCWLHLSHATQIARELGIHRPSVVAEHVKALGANATAEWKERLLRNFERTWLCVFIVDKSFGIIAGCSSNVTWKELPPCSCQWWRNPTTTPSDQMISGIIEIRVQLFEALGQLDRSDKSLRIISDLHSQALDAMERTRRIRCCPDDEPTSAPIHPILAFYMDHSLIVLNAHILRDMMTLHGSKGSPEFVKADQRAFGVAIRALDLVLHSAAMTGFRLGWHNDLFIMVAHVMTEILQAINRGNVSPAAVDNAGPKIRTVSILLGEIAQELPDTSIAHLCAILSRNFLSRFDRLGGADIPVTTQAAVDEPFPQVPGLLPALDGGTWDPAAMFDLAYFGMDQFPLDFGDFGDVR